MLVYDITNEKSFDNIKNWIRNIEEVFNPEFSNSYLYIYSFVNVALSEVVFKCSIIYLLGAACLSGC